MSVGRLDFNTEGLILLTTNGGVARFFELPKNKLIRTYKVRVFGTVDEKKIKRLEKGITIENVRYRPITVSIDNQIVSNSWLTINLSEGKNSEIRKIMLHIGLQVSRLIRISYGDFNLGSMKPLDIIEVAKKNIPKITDAI